MQEKQAQQRIDIIIPAYNAHATLRRALLSVAAQSVAEPGDVTVADDCSPKGGYGAIIDEFRPWLSVRELTLEEDIGPSLARQRALDATANPFIAFLDADDTLAGPDSLAEMRAMLLADPSLAMVSGDFFSAEESTGGDVAFAAFRGDMTWLLGNLYRRAFLEENGIRFIAPRTSEDFGFNTKVRLIAGNARIPLYQHTAYCWHLLQESATHADPLRFLYDRNAEDFTETLLDALTLAQKRGAQQKDVLSTAMYGMMDFYRRYAESSVLLPETAEKNFAQGVRFYREFFAAVERQIESKTVDLQLRMLATRMKRNDLAALQQEFDAYLARVRAAC